MSLSFGIIDDDVVCCRMLQNIIEDHEMGEVVGTSYGGTQAIRMILETLPDVVLIDLLMPEQDGIAMIGQLRSQGYQGKFVMISQIVHKEMVGKAYEAGIEFFIHKPINRVEVVSVLRTVNEKWKLNRSLLEIKQSLQILERTQSDISVVPKARTIHDRIQHILMDIGIAGESGSEDIIAIMEYLLAFKELKHFPPLKELYEGVAQKTRRSKVDIAREVKAMEQRLRRTIMTALSNLASLGLTDYSNPKFEYYAPLFFDFQDVRLKMKEIDGNLPAGKGKVNIKKFLQVFYLETLEKIKD